ncbi:hypothetical protein RvY_18415 [Ramazzottius varieornatus]|uniref:Uncharacterized protein n=1 Tax=Ramazzottius varieornatus TaxID=947166 RepID=A0A1D1WB78_RAMVA|nr:hypothetical protein RvY_18415 [Ramazzottius varieornatus]
MNVSPFLVIPEDPVGLKDVRDFTADEGTVEGVTQSGMSRMTSGTQLTRQAVAPQLVDKFFATTNMGLTEPSPKTQTN